MTLAQLPTRLSASRGVKLQLVLIPRLSRQTTPTLLALGFSLVDMARRPQLPSLTMATCGSVTVLEPRIIPHTEWWLRAKAAVTEKRREKCIHVRARKWVYILEHPRVSGAGETNLGETSSTSMTMCFL